MMRTEAIVGVLALLVAACSTAPGGGSAASTAPSTPRAPTAGPVEPTPSAAVTGGIIGEPLAAIREEFTAQGFVFDGGAGAEGLPGSVGRHEYGGTVVLDGDPLSTVGWQVTQPFIDNGPLFALLEGHGRAQVLPWLDDQHLALAASGLGGRAEAVIGDLPVLLVVRQAGSELDSMRVVLGDPAPLAAWDEPMPTPTPEPWPAELQPAMLAYSELAETANRHLTTELAVLLDPAATAAARRDAAGRAAAAEAAFGRGLQEVVLPEVVREAGTALVDASVASEQALQAFGKLDTATAMASALPDLIAVLNAESAAARAVREAMLSFNMSIGSFLVGPDPSPIGAGRVVPAAGELQEAERSLSLDSGNGYLRVAFSNPTPAFAMGVTVRVTIEAYEGPDVETRELTIGAVPPSGTAGVTQQIADLRPPGLTPQRLRIDGVSVAEWRALYEPVIGGR